MSAKQKHKGFRDLRPPRSACRWSLHHAGVDGCVPGKPGKRPTKCFCVASMAWHSLSFQKYSHFYLFYLFYLNTSIKTLTKTGGGAGNRSAPRFGVDQDCSRPHSSHRRRCRARRGGRLPDTLLGFTRHRPDPGKKVVGMSSTGSSGERATHIFTVV